MKKLDTIIDWSRDTHREKVVEYLENLPEDVYWITIKKYRRKRSTEQNAYYWGVVVDLLSKELGYYPDEVHEVLKQKFNSKRVEVDGDTYLVPQSTTDNDTYEFSQYVDRIRDWAAQELNCYIPSPQEEGFQV